RRAVSGAVAAASLRGADGTIVAVDGVSRRPIRNASANRCGWICRLAPVRRVSSRCCCFSRADKARFRQSTKLSNAWRGRRLMTLKDRSLKKFFDTVQFLNADIWRLQAHKLP